MTVHKEDMLVYVKGDIFYEFEEQREQRRGEEKVEGLDPSNPSKFR